MRVLLTGGGTAGHINPALAIAEMVKMNDPNAKIEFVGISGGKETELVGRAGYDLKYVKAKGISRSFSLSNLEALWLALTSPFSHNTTSILDDFQPDIVIGTGGYACWPIMVAAAQRHIPTAVHESNALPGLAVRQLQGKVDRIWTNFESTGSRLKEKKKIIRVGNPIRSGFGALSYEKARAKLGISENRKVILSFGGSLGAENLNLAVVDMMRDYSSKHPDVLHVHATGSKKFASAMEAFRKAGLESCDNCILKDYIHDMSLWMTAADLVISRAGAMTISELSLMQKTCILVPSPYVADNHQFINAKNLSDAGAARLVEESRLSSGELTKVSEELLASPGLQKSMQEQICRFADMDANRRIWQEIKKLVERGSQNEKLHHAF